MQRARHEKLFSILEIRFTERAIYIYIFLISFLLEMLFRQFLSGPSHVAPCCDGCRTTVRFSEKRVPSWKLGRRSGFCRKTNRWKSDGYISLISHFSAVRSVVHPFSHFLIASVGIPLHRVCDDVFRFLYAKLLRMCCADSFDEHLAVHFSARKRAYVNNYLYLCKLKQS